MTIRSLHRTCLLLNRVPQLMIATGSRSAATSSSQALINPKDEKTVKIRTCRNVYSNKSENLGFLIRNAPKGGIDVDVQYLDTDPHASSSVPTVLAVHGAPGNYQDFQDIIVRLKGKGFRVVAPNFPDLAFTNKTGCFKHTTEEKSEFLTDWLNEVGIDRVDVALMHSSGVYSTMKVWEENPSLMKSLIMINPAGHRRIRAMKPAWMTNTVSYLNISSPGRAIFNTLFVHVIRSMGTRVKNDEANVHNAVLACMTMTFAGVQRLEGYLKALSERKTPTSYLYSEKDKLVDTAIFREMVEMVGAKLSDVAYASLDGQITQDPVTIPPSWIKIISVKDGGHYAFKSYPKLLDDEVTRLLTQVYETDVVSIKKTDAAADAELDQQKSSGAVAAYAVNMKRV